MNRPSSPSFFRPWVLVLMTLSSLSADDRGCVWRVAGPGAVVYLAGSVHLLREADLPLPPAYELCYQESSRVVFEIDLQSTKTAEGQGTAARMGMLPQGEKLEDWLSPETMGLLRGYWRERKLPQNQMERLRPGMLAMTITNLEAMRIGAFPQFGVEALFDRKAREDGKKVVALETLEQQLDLFNGMNRQEQDRLLRITLEDVAEAAQSLEAMIAAWREGDGVKLAEELNRNFEPEDAGLLKRLLHDRNEAWLPVIERALREPGDGTTLFIVGAGHLVGDRSVISLLQAKGYQVAPWSVSR